MITLYNNDTNQLIGSVSEAELQVLSDCLEEEYPEDQDYYLTATTLELLAEHNAPDHLLDLLRGALGEAEGIEVRWQRH